MLSLILVLVVLGFIVYLINAYAPIDPSFKRIITFVVLFVAVLWVLQAFGLLPHAPYVRW